MSRLSIHNSTLDPNDVTRTYLWDVLIDETSSIDRDEHDRRSLSFSFLVARDLFGFTESEDNFQRYLREAPVPLDTTINRPQTWHDRCLFVYYYCWLIPMLDVQMRRGLQARFESQIVYTDQNLEYCIQLITPVIVTYWRHKSMANIEKKCLARVEAIVQGISNKEASDIDWNTMSQLGRERLVAMTDRIRRRIEREQEWVSTGQQGEPPGRRRKRKTVGDANDVDGQHDDFGDDMHDMAPDMPKTEPITEPSTETTTNQPQQE